MKTGGRGDYPPTGISIATGLRAWRVPPGILLYGAIFFFINVLFVVKYGARISLSPVLGGSGYFVFLVGQGVCTAWIAHGVSRSARPFMWLGILLAGLLAAAGVVYMRIDPVNLNLDRWSALDHFLEALLHGHFPYEVKTHLGSPISGFPGLMLLALPFYALGDVGYMQFGALIAWTALLAVRFAEGARPVYLLLTLMAMPVVAYQIFSSSDLFGNMVAVAWLMHLGRNPASARGGRLWLWALAWGFLLSTRGIVFIPLIIATAPLLKGRGVKSALVFFAIIVAVFVATFAPFYLWSPELFRLHNPFDVQAGYVPRWLLALVLLACGVIAYSHRGHSAAPRPFFHTGIILFVTILSCWFLRVLDVGWQATLWDNKFDISYFILGIPFLLVAWGESLPRTRKEAPP